MNKLLIVIPFCANDAPLAERNLDFIYKLNGKTAVGHVLLVANSDVHAEMRAKIRIIAELAFESVMETIAQPVDQKVANSKFHQMNNLFRHAALTAQTHFRWPWLWMEPDCVPVNVNWISMLAGDYESQPRKYMGWISSVNGENKFMARCGIYYPGASHELDRFCQGEVPFPLATAEKEMQGATHADLIQYLKIETVEDLKKISPKAVIVHGDKMGIIQENWTGLTMEKLNKVVESLESSVVEIKNIPATTNGCAEKADANGLECGATPPRLSRRQRRELAAQVAKV